MTRWAGRLKSYGVAILAAVALLLQGAAGMAPAQAATHTVELCTGHGSQVITLDASGKPTSPHQAPCPHCDHCLGAPPALSTTPPMLAAPVRYAVRSEILVARPMVTAVARAPPRPPGQGPPPVLNV